MNERNNINSLNNEEILKEIESKITELKKESVNDKKVKFIIFYIDDKLYAMPGNVVQEIIIDYPVFYLPFVPDYIRGLLNRHGEPYTVIDLKSLFTGSELDGKTFLVLRNKIDNIAFIISGIYKIENILEDNIHPLTSKNENMDYFEGSITIDEEEVFIVNIKNIIDRIANDIENS
ncbi:MAG TPA: chemotaxis protein CheW [Spirochaetota bacterium]|nr:chemotaxis protein CheW [Spirochaetota bacterium]HOL56141.1 chemotaxis protein CheW [Spirochaetota bacterium]HPP03994.1 chemotaxis protein CheW [Spirochaetota bacterium]